MLVGIMKGNGIGPEITAATKRVLEATGLPLQWEEIPVADAGIEVYAHPLAPEAVRRLRDIRYTIKAPFIVNKLEGRVACTQPDGSQVKDSREEPAWIPKGADRGLQVTYPSLNNAVRRELGLFVNPRPIQGYSGISGRHESMDMVIMREVTEDVYVGVEHTIGDDMAAEAIKLTTRAAATRVSRYGFEYARKHGRKRVSCLHKANVLNLTDGLFLRCFSEVSRDYPEIEADDMMIDAACYTVVRDPQRFDVVVTSNQYGDIFSDLAAGLAGSLGLAGGVNIGDEAATFEASHGAAPDIA